jgi:hypothetical protein
LYKDQPEAVTVPNAVPSCRRLGFAFSVAAPMDLVLVASEVLPAFAWSIAPFNFVNPLITSSKPVERNCKFILKSELDIFTNEKNSF